MNGLRTERGSRVVAASGIAAIVLAFVYATQPAIAKAPLCETAAWGLLILLAGILGVIHFFLRVKIDITEPVIYGSILALLLGARIMAKISAAKPFPERGKTPLE